MTADERTQLKAYARVDGAVVAAAWTASFALYVAGTAHEPLMLASLAAGLLSVAVAYRLTGRFRDAALGGSITFGRAWGHAALTFAYASLLFAAAQLAYFQLIDRGYMASQVERAAADPTARAAIEAAGASESLDHAIGILRRARPIDIALAYLPGNLALGCALAVPIAAGTRRRAGSEGKRRENIND